MTMMLEKVLFAALIILMASSSCYYYPTVIAAYAQEGNQQQQQELPRGNITNSKYLTITEQQFVPQPPSLFNNPGTITGKVANNATFNISFPSVTAILYDENNIVITTEDTLADITTLGAGQESPFSISLSSLSPAGGPRTEIDHYTLIPGGTP
jgi:hypothetical protein